MYHGSGSKAEASQRHAQLKRASGRPDGAPVRRGDDILGRKAPLASARPAQRDKLALDGRVLCVDPRDLEVKLGALLAHSEEGVHWPKRPADQSSRGVQSQHPIPSFGSHTLLGWRERGLFSRSIPGSVTLSIPGGVICEWARSSSLLRQLR